MTITHRLAQPGIAAADEPLQLLTPDGDLRTDIDFELDVTAELCRTLYRDMALTRRFDQEGHHLQRQGQLGLWLSCRGQEASQVGSMRALRSSDYVFPSYREHAAALIRQVDPGALLAQWRGTAHGAWDPDVHRFHINSLVLGTQTLHATGYALGVRLDGADEVVLVYFGDGSTSQGDVNEALNWSACTHAPIVFFCQNNHWAISTPVSSQTRVPLHVRAAGFGLTSYCVDGNDVLAVLAVTAAAAESVRRGGPPAFIESLTYRMAGHSTSDDPRRYREDDEVSEWEDRDPVSRLLTFMQRRGWADPDYLASVDAEGDELAAETRRACLALAEPELDDTFRTTLVAETALLRREHEQFNEYQSSLL